MPREYDDQGDRGDSAFEFCKLVGAVFPLFGRGQRVFALGNGLEVGRKSQLSVDLDHVLLVFGQIFFGVDGINRALRDANGAIDAFIGIDGQEVGAFLEAIDRADVHAIGVFALNAGFGDNVGHFILTGIKVVKLVRALCGMRNLGNPGILSL